MQFVIPGFPPISSTEQAPEPKAFLDSRLRGNDGRCCDL
jgi:hypothetical protein